MIDIRKLKELVRLMVSNDITEIDLRDSQEQVTLKRAGVQLVPQITHVSPAAPAAAAGAASAGASGAAAPPVLSEDDDLVAIESPMVGTFYASASPEKPAFVKVGDSIGPETVVCLIEAMKVFNEIKAESGIQSGGVIERVLVKNGQPIEFGQKLFLIRPV